MTDTVQTYKRPARRLHWLMALLVLLMIPVGVIMTQQGLPRPLQNTLFVFHKNVGVLMLVLIVIRWIYRSTNPPPPEPSDVAEWQIRIAELNHWLLYLLLIVMPVSGYIRVRAGGFPIEVLDAWGVPALVPRSEMLASVAKTIHMVCGYTLAALIALHIGAALYHAIVRRDGVFFRMWPGRTS